MAWHPTMEQTFRLHLRCRCCQGDAFLEAPRAAAAVSDDVALRTAVQHLEFQCAGCSNDTASLVAFTFVGRASDARPTV